MIKAEHVAWLEIEYLLHYLESKIHVCSQVLKLTQRPQNNYSLLVDRVKCKHCRNKKNEKLSEFPFTFCCFYKSYPILPKIDLKRVRPTKRHMLYLPVVSNGKTFLPARRTRRNYCNEVLNYDDIVRWQLVRLFAQTS